MVKWERLVGLGVIMESEFCDKFATASPVQKELLEIGKTIMVTTVLILLRKSYSASFLTLQFHHSFAAINLSFSRITANRHQQKHV